MLIDSDKKTLTLHLKFPGDNCRTLPLALGVSLATQTTNLTRYNHPISANPPCQAESGRFTWHPKKCSVFFLLGEQKHILPPKKEQGQFSVSGMYTKDSTKPLHLCSQKPERTIFKNKSPDSKDATKKKPSKAPRKAGFFS